MDWPQELPNPDDVVKTVLSVIFGPGLIVFIFVLLNFLMGWFGMGRAALRLGRNLQAGFGRTVQEARATSRWSSTWKAIGFMTVAAQLGWVGLGFYAANVVEWGFGNGPQGRGIVDAADLLSYVSWTPLSQVWVGTSAVALVAAYTCRPPVVDLFKFVMAGAPAVLGFFGLVGTALAVAASLLTNDDDYTPRNILYVFTIGSSAAAYAYATAYALSSVEWLRRVAHRA